MLILIVDDDHRKRDRIVAAITEAVGTRAIDVDYATNAGEAAMKLEERRVDLLVLDLFLPMREGENPNKDGGLRLLKQLLKAGPRFRRPVHILGLTAYDESADSASSDFLSEGWQLIRYDETSEGWAESVQNKVRHIAESLRNPNSQHQCDLAIITALKTIELDAVLRLPGDWQEGSFVGDPTVYHTGRFRRGDLSRTVIAAAAIEMGMAATASLATKIIMQFRPRYLAIAGITAGIGDLHFGDVIVADQAWDYGSGKVRSTGKSTSVFAPAPNYIPIDAGLKELAELFITHRRQIIAEIKQRWPANAPPTELAARTGPVASGAAVVESAQEIEEIQNHNRKLAGVDMEIYGAYLAARIAPEPRPIVFAAKAVCDFGKPPKTDEYQKYAGFTSANFIYEFYLDQLARIES